MRVEWSLQIDLFAALYSTFDHFQIPRESLPSLVVHVPGSFIAYPCVCSSSTRINPHNVPEPEVFSQRRIYHLDRHSDKRPAPLADLCFVATSAYLVVVCQVYVKDKLFRYWPKCSGLAESFSVSWVRRVDRAYFKAKRVETKDVFAETVKVWAKKWRM